MLSYSDYLWSEINKFVWENPMATAKFVIIFPFLNQGFTSLITFATPFENEDLQLPLKLISYV